MTAGGPDYILTNTELAPDNPAIGFPQRKTDTLAALNQAWVTFVSG